MIGRDAARDLRRDVEGAAAQRFDLVVVGGGILGAMTALLAAAAGLATVLIERDDFGGGATWNSLRILHGGLRSLQRLDLAAHRAAAVESAFLRAAFPELIAPLPCLLPLDGRGARRRPLAAAALAADRILGGVTTRGLPPGRLLDAGELRRAHPAAAGASTGLLWYDGRLLQPARLVTETLRWAAAAGEAAGAPSIALSRVEALGLLGAGGAVAGIAARDALTGAGLELRAPAVAWCAGTPCPGTATAPGLQPDAPPPRVLAFNLLLARELPGEHALAVRSRSGAMLFLVPAGGATLAGTCYVTDGGAPTDSHVERFVADLAVAAPFLELDPSAVLRVLAGHQPAAGAGIAAPASRAVHHDHERAGGLRGLCCAWPAKLTTARREAARLLRSLGTRPGRPLNSRPAGIAVPHPEAAWRLASERPAVLAELAARLVADECVLTAEDLLLRRTDWALDPRRQPVLEAALATVLPRG